MKSVLVITAVTTTLVGVVLVNQTPDFLTLIIRILIAIIMLVIFLIPVRRQFGKRGDVIPSKIAAAVGFGLGIGAILSHELVLCLISWGVE